MFEDNTGKVKFQNAFIYYDIMYAIYKNVIKLSNSCSVNNYLSIKAYHDSLFELFCYVESYLKEQNTSMYYKIKLAKLIKITEADNDFLTNDLKLSKNAINELRLINNKEIKNLTSYFDLVKSKLDTCVAYLKVPMELSKRLRTIKTLLDNIKRELAFEMMKNKLTVPLETSDPSRAMIDGFR